MLDRVASVCRRSFWLGALTALASGQILTTAGAPVPVVGAPADAYLGWSIDRDADRLIVGATGWVEPAGMGAALIFVRSPSGWVEEQRLLGPVTPLVGFGDFGFAVAIDGTTVAVGDPRDDGGRVRIFERSASVWTETALVADADPLPTDVFDLFGHDVALNGDVVAIGDPSGDGLGIQNQGAVVVVERSAGNWSTVARLEPPIPHPLGGFGQSVDVLGDTIAVGERGFGPHAGRLHVFRNGPNGWAHEATLFGQNFGSTALTNPSGVGESVALGPDELVGGTRGTGGGGGALVFARAGTTWTQTAQLVPALSPVDQAGVAVALDGDRLAVADETGDEVVLWARQSNGWGERQRFVGPSGQFGRSITLGASELIVGAPFVDAQATPDRGAAYALGVAPAFGASYCFGDGLGSACPCGFDAIEPAASGCRNFQGDGAVLVAHGSPSVAANAFLATAVNLVPFKASLLIFGTQSGAGLPFGDGLLCIGGAIKRAQLVGSDANGVAAFGPGPAGFGPIAAGDDRYFQVWYRTDFGCGFGFNLTNGFEVTFLP